MQDQLVIFKSLFKGRNDVFAIRWEKEGKSGYWPAIDINWTEYSLHKARGGSMENFPDKKNIPLTDERLTRHLKGGEIIGIYPLLQDDTSWFIAADFDQSESGKKNWIEECKTFIAACENQGLPVYLNVPDPGKGAIYGCFSKPLTRQLKAGCCFLPF